MISTPKRQAERVKEGLDRYLNAKRFYTRFARISYMPGWSLQIRLTPLRQHCNY